MASLLWSIRRGIFVGGYSLLNAWCGIFVVESFVVESIIIESFVVESLLWSMCCGIFVVETLLWDLRCGIVVVESLLWDLFLVELF